MRIAVAGIGYVGLVTACCLADVGHDIICIDVNEEKLTMARSGKSPIYEAGLEELMVANSDHIEYTSDYKKAYKDAEVIIIGVGTPEKSDGSANLEYVYTVAKNIAETVERDCVVVIKSTVPIGTNDVIEKYINDNLVNDVKVEIVSNPEFLAQGTAVRDTIHASRIVIGAESEYAKEVMARVYEGFDSPVLFTNRRSAEMIKYASNDFLALKISYINEIANICEMVGADIQDVARGMSYDERIGSKFLQAGIGYGGSCFPKDTKALHWLASMYEYELKTVKATIEINEKQKIRLLKKAKRYYENMNGLTAAVLGLTFKPGTDDLREAPSLECVPMLLEDGVKIKAWDPVGVENYKKIYPNQIEYCNSIVEALRDADICFIFTEWQEVKDTAPEAFLENMKKPIILDGRNCYSLDTMRAYPLVYDSIGRAAVENI